MSAASRARYDYLQNAPSLQYGDYQVTKDWKVGTNPLLGHGGAGVIAFNPNDTSQRFYLDDPNSQNAQDLSEYLSGNNLSADQFGQYFGQDTTGRYESVFKGDNVKTLEQIAEQKRMQELAARMSAGTLSVAEGDAMANNPAMVAQLPKTQAQLLYEQTKAQPKPTNTSSPKPAQQQGLQFPSFDEALFQEYRNRPDLQALYNPDGTAKNPNDPRIGGIPTLQEWANKYGVNESQLLKTALANPAGRNAPTIPTTPVSLNPSTQVSSTALAGGKTMGDVEGLMKSNSQKYGDIRDQILKAMMPGQTELGLEKKMADLDSLTRNLQLSAQAGINQIKNKQIPMQFIVGQAKSVMEDANLQLQTLSAERASIVDQLGLAQRAREVSLNVLQTLYQFDKEDEAVAEQAKKLQRAEQEASKEFALQYGITAPFYKIGSTVYNTSTGKAYSTPEEFFKAGGAKDWSNIQNVEVQQDEGEELLSPSEAKTLGVPYGTTKGQATSMGITPSFVKASSQSKSGPAPTKTPATNDPLTNGLRFSSSTAVDKSIPSVISRAGGLTNENRYDLWDKVAQAIESQGKNPSDYDQILWKYFHPEGSSGYKKYVLGQSNVSSSNYPTNPSSDLP